MGNTHNTAVQNDLATRPAHTPGPWRIGQPWSGYSDIRGPEGELIFSIAAHGTMPEEVCEANARLIAAAPDMLAALKKVQAHFPPQSGLSPDEEELLKAVDAAIAKAEGC